MTDPSLLASVQRDLLDGKPLPDVLRKCILLGSESGSAEPRAWASKELKGYENVAELPAYRKVPSQIQADATTGNAIVRGQPIGLSMLPDWVREHITSQVPLFAGVGELESLLKRDASLARAHSYRCQHGRPSRPRWIGLSRIRTRGNTYTRFTGSSARLGSRASWTP